MVVAARVALSPTTIHLLLSTGRLLLAQVIGGICAAHGTDLCWHHLWNHLLLAAVLRTEHATVVMLMVLWQSSELDPLASLSDACGHASLLLLRWQLAANDGLGLLLLSWPSNTTLMIIVHLVLQNLLIIRQILRVLHISRRKRPLLPNLIGMWI